MKPKFPLHGVELVAVGDRSLLKAQRLVTACEACSESASRPFGWLLNEVIGRNGGFTEYVLCSPARCPRCATQIVETTLILSGRQPEDAETAIKDFEPCWEKTTLVLVDAATLLEAQEYITACEHCAENADITFDYVLDAVTACDPTVTEYVMCRPANCPRCYRKITEKTLVLAQ